MVGVRLRLAALEPAFSVYRCEAGVTARAASALLPLVHGLARDRRGPRPGARPRSRRIVPRRRVSAAGTLRSCGARVAVAARDGRRVIQAALVAGAFVGTVADRAGLCRQSRASAICRAVVAGEAGESPRGRAG